MSTIEVQLLLEVNKAIQGRNPLQLQSILVIEPPFSPIYEQLIVSLKAKYPQNNPSSEENLEHIVRTTVLETDESEDDQGRPVPNWSSMVSFLTCWMSFVRDVNVENLLETYERLSDLQQKVNSALQHSTKGILVLPTVIAYAKVFSRVAIGLDKRPELIAHLVSATSSSEEGRAESLPEKAANILRNAFTTCLNDRNVGPRGITPQGKPDGKKIGIYKMANICLKILFQCEKLDNCQTIFNNIQNSSPPLSIYPASERVTYLYYLGRYHFACTHFFAAQLALQRAYDESPTAASCIPQRRLLLIYLIASNLLLGRLPSQSLYTRPEAAGLREHFGPLAQAIRTGDLALFRRITSLDLSHPSARFFSHYRLFYQLANYCEIFLWRSLFRRVFILTGKQGDTDRSAPTLDLHAVLAAFRFLESRARNMTPALERADAGGPGNRHISLALSDFSTPGPGQGYVDADFDGLEGVTPYVHTPDIMEMEAIGASLITQGFLNGYISHKLSKFAIQGARRPGGAVKNGFPGVWGVVRARNGEEVFGWKKEGRGGAGVGGTVVRLSGARPAGA